MGRTRASGAKVVTQRQGFHAKTGITFPVRRIQRYLRGHHLINHKSRVSTTAALYLAAVLEYVVAEVLELAGMAAKHNKKRRINPRWIWLAIKSDEEFSKVLKGSIMPESGNLWGQAIASPQKNSAMPTLLAPKKMKRKTKQPILNRLQTGITTTSDADASTGGTVETLGRTLISGVQLSVLKADITSVEADCYVNPTSSSIGFGGQVGSRLVTVGGNDLSAATQPFMNQTIPDCGAVITPAQGLKATHIIHVNSPAWNDTNSIQKLEATVKNCLDVACRNKVNSVAVPSIGSGNNGIPKHTAAQTILKSISDYFKNKQTEFVTKKIIFVLFDQQSVNVYRTELGRLVE